MKLFDDVPMTDAEAEAALLALGPRLEWYKVAWHEEGWQALAGDGSYSVLNGVTRELTISAKKPFLFYSPVPVYNVWFMRNDAEDYEPPIGIHKTHSAAKAACERHHATGKWE